MKTKPSFLSLLRSAAFVLLGLATLSQIGCSTTGQPNAGGWASSRDEDMSKIFVYPLTASPNLQLPPARANAPKILTNAIQQQLYEERRLQTDERVHSLSLYGVVLSYQNGIIDVQGELYDDDKFLVYSRVTRRLEAGEDWNQGLNLVAEQMLDELMLKLYPRPATGGPVEPCGYAGCPELTVVETGPTIYLFDSFCWGCWRDDDYGHNPNPRPRPKPHWVPGAILESLPRIPHEHPIKPSGSSGSGTTGTSGTGGFGGGRGHGGGSTTSPSSGGGSLEPSTSGGPGSIYHTRSLPRTTEIYRTPSVSSPRSEDTTPTRSTPTYEPPRSEVSRPQSVPVVRESSPEPRREESTPSYEPPRTPEVSRPQAAPVVRESAPATRTEAPSRPSSSETSRSEPSQPSSTSVGGSTPRRRDSSSSDGNSGGSSGGGRRR